MQINFYLDTNQRTTNPERIIFCYIRGLQKGQTIKLHTGERINPEYWNPELQRAIEKGKKRYVGAPELNSYLNAFEEKIKKTVRITKAEDMNMPYEDLKILIVKEFKGTDDNFFKLFDTFLDVKKTEISDVTRKKFETLKNHLLNFSEAKKYAITFNSINHLFYDLFLNYLIESKDRSNNTTGKLISNLKVFLNWATKRKLNKNLEFREFKMKWNEADNIALTKEEFYRLQNFDFPGKANLDRVRDVFCFSCLTGVRYSDVAKLDIKDINNNVWSFKAQKTKDNISIPLLEDAVKIVNKYRDTGKLPVLSNQKMNKYIKEICKIAGIDTPTKKRKVSGAKVEEEIFPKYELIGTHTARRTFVTLSLELGMRPEVVMKITGHKSLAILQKYIKIDEKVKEEEMREAWGK